MVKWKLVDPTNAAATYTFEINPNEFEGPPRKKRISYAFPTAPGSQLVVFEGRDEPQTIRFSGAIISSAQYDAMKLWFSKRYPVYLDDDRGIRYIIYITSFDPRRQRSRLYPFRYTYTVEAVIYEGTAG